MSSVDDVLLSTPLGRSWLGHPALVGEAATVLTVLVTGTSGAGKSALARRLAALGYDAVSTDSAEGLCRWVDDAGQPVARPVDPDLMWLNTHHWVWDPPTLDRIIGVARDRGVEVLFLCGDASNALDVRDRIDVIMLLRIDLATMLARLADPARGNDFGRIGQTRQYLVRSFDRWQHNLLRHADVVVDATADLDTVAREVVQAATQLRAMD